MIRGTINEGISSLTKQRHAGSFLTTTGVKGEGRELIFDTVGNQVDERQDAVDAHITTRSDFPSNAFNGTFE